MKWFKHYTSMAQDVKIKRLVRKFGVEGYGLYNYILELIVRNMEDDRPVPDLEESAVDVAADLHMDTVRVEEIMLFCIEQELFEQDEITGRVVASKIYRYLEKSSTRSEQIKRMIDGYKLGLSETVRDSLRLSEQDKKRKEEKRQEESIPYQSIIEYLNSRCDTNYRHTSEATRRHISARWSEGFREDDFRRVIDSRADLWEDDEKMSQYLRPQTLFGTKFESYLNAAPEEKRDSIEWEAEKAREGLIRFDK